MPSGAERRAFAALLFVDIVGSTGIATELGDRRWQMLVDRFHVTVRSELHTFGGREIDTAGDGTFAAFDAPGRALRCAAAVASTVRAHGLEVRCGIHSGEVERVGTTARGIAVHVAARVIGFAGAGEVIVTQTVRDIVAGSPVGFEDAGTHELRGVPGEWHLFRVTDLDGQPLGPPLDAQEAAHRRELVSEPARPGRWRIPVVGVGLAATVVTILLLTLVSDPRDEDPGRPAPPQTQPTADEQRLLSLIPASIGASCSPTPHRPPEALAAADCEVGDVQAHYTLFGNKPSMDEWFDGSVLNVAAAPPGDCGVDHLAEGTWSTGQVRAGRVLCYQKRGASSIEWTDERFLVLGQASRDDLGDLELHRWWLVEAGPWEQGGERRDGGARVVPLPEGTYRMRITQQDFEEHQALTGGVLHSWVGTWTLRVGDGEYEVDSPDPVYDDRGFYVYGKEGHVAVYTTNQPACEGDPEVVTWSIENGLLGLSRAVRATDCGGTQTDPPPWELHPWRHVA